MFKATDPENARKINAIADVLRHVSVGETLRYAALRSAGYRDERDSWLLGRAREIVEKELGCCFATVRTVGVKRLTSDEIPSVGLLTLRKIRRAANRGKKRLDRVNVNSLSQSEQRRVVGMSAMLGAVSLVSDGRKAVAIGAVADPVKPIPPKNILDMFRTEEKAAQPSEANA